LLLTAPQHFKDMNLLQTSRGIPMETDASLRELREEDLDAVSAGMGYFGILNLISRLFGHRHFSSPHFETPNFGNLFSGESVVQTNTAVEIAVVVGGGSVSQVINQSNVA
jgi:hypothetical protein